MGSLISSRQKMPNPTHARTGRIRVRMYSVGNPSWGGLPKPAELESGALAVEVLREEAGGGRVYLETVRVVLIFRLDADARVICYPFG